MGVAFLAILGLAAFVYWGFGAIIEKVDQIDERLNKIEHKEPKR